MANEQTITPAPAPELLRYSALLLGPGFPTDGQVVEEFTAEHDAAAVDHVRTEHLERLCPVEGGAFEVEVTALDKSLAATKHGDKTIMISGPAGVVSRWGVFHEPYPSVAAEVRAKHAETLKLHDEQAKHDAVLDELVAKGTVTAEQIAAARSLPPEVAKTRKAEHANRVAQHRERAHAALDELVRAGALSPADHATAKAALASKETVK